MTEGSIYLHFSSWNFVKLPDNCEEMLMTTITIITIKTMRISIIFQHVLIVKVQKDPMLVSDLLLVHLLAMMARDVLTRWRWLRRLSMMMQFNVTTLMTRDVTLLMLQIMSPNRRKIVKRTTGRIVLLSTNRLHSMRQSRFAELLQQRIEMFRDLRFVELNMSLSAGPSRRFMMLKMMLLSVRPLLRRNVKMRPPVTPQTPSAQSGPRRMYQGTKGTVCSCRLWFQGRSRGVL